MHELTSVRCTRFPDIACYELPDTVATAYHGHVDPTDGSLVRCAFAMKSGTRIVQGLS